MRPRIILPALAAATIVLAAGSVWSVADGWHRVGATGQQSQHTRSEAPALSPPAGTTVAEQAAVAGISATATNAPTPPRSPGHQATSPHPPATHPASARVPVVAAPAPRPDSSPAVSPTHRATVTPVSTDAVASTVFDALNSFRRQHGLAALRWSSALATSATRHSAVMNSDNTLSHQLPGEADPGQRMTAAGFRWTQWAENCFGPTTTTGTAAGLQAESWFENDAPHAANILNAQATDVGVGISAESNGTIWVTEDFGRSG